MAPSQLLILGVPGPELTPEDVALYRELQPGGFILFTRNIVSLEQTRRLTDDLRALSDTEPFLCIDNEGGRVWRTAPFGHAPPSADQLRVKGDAKHIITSGWITGRLLRLLGLNFNLAPVLDIHPDAADAPQARCWGHTDQEVINNAGVFNRYQRKQGILGCGKQFPAGGRATTARHHDLPVVDLSIGELLQSDLLPYTALAPELDGIMLGHMHFPRIDGEQPGLPASLSRAIITRLLRDQLGFDRLVLTDDLDLAAIRNTYGTPRAARLAVEAGADLLLLCHEIQSAPETLAALQDLPHHVLSDALQRIERAKKRMHPPTKCSRDAFDAINNDTWQLRVDTLGEDAAALPPPSPPQTPAEDY